MRKALLAVLFVGLMTGFAPAEKREPVSSKDIEREVMQVLDAYMAAWNNKDLVAWEKTFHFPHFRLAGGKMNVLDRPGMQDAGRIWTSVGSDWHHSRWDRRKIVHASADKVHVDTKFTRCRADGSVISTFESLYILTKEDGQWGVKLRSSFAP